MFAGREGNGLFFLILPVARAVLALCCCCEEAKLVVGWGLGRRRRRRPKEKGKGLEEVGCGQRRQEPVAAWHSSPGFYLPEGKIVLLRLGGLLYPCDGSSFADR